MQCYSLDCAQGAAGPVNNRISIAECMVISAMLITISLCNIPCCLTVEVWYGGYCLDLREGACQKSPYGHNI